MAYTVVPTVVDGDDLIDDYTLAVKSAIDELKAAVPLTTTTFTPSFANFTLGTGSTSGRYIRLGPLIVVEVSLVFNTGSAITGSLGLTLPVNCVAQSLGVATILDSGTRHFVAAAQFNSSSDCVFTHSESGNVGLVNGTNPMTWAAGDILRATLVYTTA